MAADHKSLKSIIIVGGGTAGWVSAAVLSRVAKHLNYSITLIESPDVPTIGVGEATIPSIVDLLEFLDIPQEDFVKKTNATFKLAIKFIDWLRIGHHYWHPFGAIGSKIDTVPFYHHWLRYHNSGGKRRFAEFSPSIAMARINRFFIPDPKTPTNLSKSAHALHFDAALVADYLAEYSMKNGVQRIWSHVESAALHHDGRVKSVLLSDNRCIPGDFFIDCSGQRALLIGQYLRVGYIDWSQYLPVNRAVVMQTKNVGEPAPFTEATAHEHGWRWRIPLQSRTGNGYVYCSDYCDDTMAENLLVQQVAGRPVTEPRVLRFRTGKRERMWHKNCLAVGLSAGFLEPLESTGIYLIMRAILNFVQMLPDRDFAAPTIVEFNRLMDMEYDCIRDFIVLHYCASERRDSPFWEMWQNVTIPDSLHHKLALFRSQGRLYRNDLDLFAPDSWYAVLEGMNVRPDGFDPRVEASDLAQVMGILEQGAGALAEAANRVPAHSAFIANLISSPNPGLERVG